MIERTASKASQSNHHPSAIEPTDRPPTTSTSTPPAPTAVQHLTTDQLRKALTHARTARQRLHECRRELLAAQSLVPLGGPDWQIDDALQAVDAEYDLSAPVSQIEIALLRRGESIDPPSPTQATIAHSDQLKRIEARLRRGVVLLGALSDLVNHRDFDDNGDEAIADINKTLYGFDQDVGSLDRKLCDALTTIIHHEAYKESDRLTAELEAA